MRNKNEILLVLITMVFISVIFAMPHIYGFKNYGINYWTLISNSNLSHVSEETYTYAPEVHQILKGHWRGDPYIWEHRSDPSPYVSELSSIIPVAFLALLSGSVANSFTLADFIFPALMFLLIVYFLRRLNYDHFFSISTSLAVVLIPFISMLLPKIQSHGTLLTGSSFGPLFFTRTPHPQISTIFVFLTLFLTVLLFESNFKKIRLIIFWSIAIAVSTYSSFYVASTILFGTLFLFPALLKKIPPRYLIISLLIYILLVMPFLINAFEQRQILMNSDFLTRFTFTKQFMFPIQIRYLIFGLLFYLVARKNWLAKILLVYILAASILMDLHQLIFRVNIQADHWISRILAPLGTLTLFLIVDKFVPRNKKKIWIGIAMILLIIGISRQLFWLNIHKDELVGDIGRKKIVAQIASSTKPDDVIGSFSSDLNKELVANTGRWLYIASGDRTWISTDEASQRICNLALLLKRESSEDKIAEPIFYFLALEVKNAQKVDRLTQDVNSCIEKREYQPNYKLDYIIFKTPNDQWELRKVNSQI